VKRAAAATAETAIETVTVVPTVARMRPVRRTTVRPVEAPALKPPKMTETKKRGDDAVSDGETVATAAADRSRPMFLRK